MAFGIINRLHISLNPTFLVILLKNGFITGGLDIKIIYNMAFIEKLGPIYNGTACSGKFYIYWPATSQHLHFSPNIVIVIKYVRQRWAGHAALM
jgi:hypothetical protein